MSFQALSKEAGHIAANRDLTTLQAVFTWGISRNRWYVTENPFKEDGGKRAVDRFQEQARTRRLYPGEGEKLLAACEPRLRAIVECALETGMRRGEITSLQWWQLTLS